MYAVGRHAKKTLVSEFGIGEELAMNIMGWIGDQLGCVAQMDLSWGTGSDEERLERVAETAVVMRRGWKCDSFTLLAEGYVSRDPDFSKDKHLVDAYLEDSKGRVTECLSICHVENEDDMDICAVPFKVKGRNRIEFGPLLRSDSTDTLRNAGFVALLAAALRIDDLEAPPIEEETFHLALATGLAESAGFFLQYDL